MPLASNGSYSYGNIQAFCRNGYGCISVDGVDTNNETTLTFTLIDPLGNVTAAFQFPSNTENGTIDFEYLPNGLITVEIMPSGGDAVEVFRTLSCQPACDLVVTAVNIIDGTIQIAATSTAGDLEYSLDPVNNLSWQTSDEFPLPGPGFHTAYVRDGGGCEAELDFSICDISLTIISQVADSITVESDSPALPVQYSLDRKTWQTSGTFEQLLPIEQTINAKDAAGCETSIDIAVESPVTECCYTLFYLIIDNKAYEILEPVGWDNLTQELTRDKQYHGIGKEYSKGTLDFECNSGMDLIEQQFALHGQDAVIGFVVLFRSCEQEYFQKEYEGTLNLNDRVKTPSKVSCNIEVKAFADLLKTRFKTKVDLTSELNLDQQDSEAAPQETISLHSKSIIRRFESEQSEDIQVDLFDTDERQVYGQVGLDTILADEIPDQFNLPTAINTEKPAGFIAFTEDGQYAIDCKIDFEVRIKDDATFPGNLGRVQIRFYFEHEGILYQEVSPIDLTISDSIYASGPTEASWNFILNGKKGLELYLYCSILVENSSSNFEYRFLVFEGSYLKIRGNTSFLPTQSKSYLLHEALSKGFAAITGMDDCFKSEYYGRTDSWPRSYAADGCGSLRAIAPGFWVRQFPDKPFPVSMQEIMESLLAMDNIGLRLETEAGKDLIVVEPAEDFYQDHEVLRFDNISDYKELVALEYIFNEIEIGYEEWENEEVNGLDEFNTKHEYLTPIKTHQNKLLLKSKMNASGYALEFTRRKQFTEAATTDYKYDNSTFVVALNRGGSQTDYEAERNQAFDLTEGIIDPVTAYNLRLSPLRNLLKHAPFINSGLYYKDEEQQLIYTYGEGNTKLSTILKSTEPCPEGDWQRFQRGEGVNIPLFELQNFKRLFKPAYQTFKAPMTREQYNTLQADKYGYITAWTGEKYISGWILELKRKSGEATFKLIERNGLIYDPLALTNEYSEFDYNPEEHN